MDQIEARARRSPKRILFPEGEEGHVVQAAALLLERGLARPVLLGRPASIRETARAIRVDASALDIIDIEDSTEISELSRQYAEERSIPESAARRIVSQPLCFGAMLTRRGTAHGMVAGLAHATEDVVTAAQLIIGLQQGVSSPSSFFLMEVPDCPYGEDGRLIFADPAIIPAPDAEQLCDIAIAGARSARGLLGWEPRVAMLSFSTKGSADHRSIRHVIEATEMVRRREPGLAVDGELQADAALVPAVAAKKLPPSAGSPGVAGSANTLIFPDLNAANIGSKLVQRLAGAHAYGPLLQGFARPVSDLSRGATVEDVVGAAVLVAAQDPFEQPPC